MVSILALDENSNPCVLLLDGMLVMIFDVASKCSNLTNQFAFRNDPDLYVLHCGALYF